MADGAAQTRRGEERTQSRADTSMGRDRLEQHLDKCLGSMGSLRLSLPAVQSPLGDPAKMQGNGAHGSSLRSLANLTEGLKLDLSSNRSPPRAASVLESPFKRPPALLGPFPSGLQSPEVSKPLGHCLHCMLIGRRRHCLLINPSRVDSLRM